MGYKDWLGILCIALLMLVMSVYVIAQDTTGLSIDIHEPADGITVYEQTVSLRATATSPDEHPVERYEVLVNGWLVEQKGVDPVLPGQISTEINLQAGENEIVLKTYNDLGVAQKIIRVYYEATTPKPNLYILSIGVSKYANLPDELQLHYAHLDAQDIAAAFATQEGRLFDKVEAVPLLNEGASRGDILDSLDWILRQTTQYDVAIIFVSGHGMLHEVGEDYYFLPHDGDPERLRSTAILWSQFDNVLERLPGLSVLFVDTCHAGGVAGEGKGWKAASLDLAIRDLTTAGKGAFIMASSTGPEISLERAEWGHGAFTKAILEGLEGGADYDGNGVIYTTELDNYVTDRVKELTGGAQHPTTRKSTDITAFPLFALAWGEAGPTSEPITATPKEVAIDTATPTDTPTATDTPVPPTDTPAPPTSTPTEAATPTPTCVPDAAFVADVTVPDNAVFEPGGEFEKVWRLRNSGSCAWDEGYKLVFVSGEQMGAPASQPVPATAPEGTADVGITMQSPQTDGAYKGVWQMQAPSGQLFGQEVTVVIAVQSAPGVGSTKINPKDGAEVVYVPPGEFTMGSGDDDSMAYDREKPQHKVYLDAFWIYKNEVTNAQYKKCVEAGACTSPQDTKYYDDPAYADHPVVYVDWYQAKAYSEWAEGRLPTEAEWEKAARGTGSRIYPWGNEWGASKLNSAEGGPGHTTEVSSYLDGASSYGCLDMAGNVWEWTGSLWGKDWDSPDYKYPYAADDGRENLEAGDDVLRVLRGGSWYDDRKRVRCAFRARNYPNSYYDYNGFRVVLAP